MNDDDDDDDCLFIVTLFAAVLWYNSLRKRSRLTKSVILEPKLSQWARLHQFGNEKSFLDLTSFTRKAFRNLKIVLFGVCDNKGRRVGCPSSLDLNGEVGLNLIFGVVSTTAAVYTYKIMKRIILVAIQSFVWFCFVVLCCNFVLACHYKFDFGANRLMRTV